MNLILTFPLPLCLKDCLDDSRRNVHTHPINIDISNTNTIHNSNPTPATSTLRIASMTVEKTYIHILSILTSLISNTNHNSDLTPAPTIIGLPR